MATKLDSAETLDRLLADAHLASAPKKLRKVVGQLRTKIDKGQLSRYRHKKGRPRKTTAKVIEELTAILGPELTVRADGW